MHDSSQPPVRGLYTNTGSSNFRKKTSLLYELLIQIRITLSNGMITSILMGVSVGKQGDGNKQTCKV